MDAEQIAEIRHIVGQFGTYGPRFYWDDGVPAAYWWEPIPVDRLTDDEVIRVARAISKQLRRLDEDLDEIVQRRR